MTLHVSNLAAEVQRPSKAGFSTYRLFFKRVIDLFLVIISAPIVLPVILVLAFLVAVLTGGRPFYSQLRVGRNGKAFRMWKLRTMVENADALLENYLKQNPEARAEWNKTQKLKKDPRVTSVGCMMRKTSLDELPQLFNVFNGTMSLVGPRPMMVGQEEIYHGQAYYALRPGITGFWQISDRNHCGFADRVAYDTAYYSEMSFTTDLRILWRTVGVVLRATGY